MEKIQSIINSFQINLNEGATNTQLLRILDELRSELVHMNPESDNTRAPIAILLPAGYHYNSLSSKDNKANILPNEGAALMEAISELPELKPFQKPSVESIRIDDSPKVDLEIKEVSKFPKEESKEEAITKSEEVAEVSAMEEIALEQNMDEVTEPLVFQASQKEKEAQVPKETINTIAGDEKPQVYQLNLDHFFYNQDDDESIEGYGNEDVIQVSEVKVSQAKPKELHEMLANRVMAESPKVSIQKPVPLADKLSAQKILDLKKSIGINDKFRFIHSLFRGDEAMFERAIKTINNFGILQEAQYWIQRELTIKLGWNDEDELVQQFYNLVSRRFL